MRSALCDRPSILMLALALSMFAAVSVAAEPWQSYGNFTSDNITLINSTFQIAMANSNLGPAAVAENISNTLNAKWSPAWNVFIIKQIYSSETAATLSFSNVVYGYAFWGHWLWFNKIYETGSQPNINYYTLIVWKDYNCGSWHTITSSTSESQLSSPQYKFSVIQKVSDIAYYDQTLYQDSWRFAYQSVNAVESMLNNAGAFTMIVLNNGGQYYSRVCLKTNSDGPVFFKDGDLFIFNVDFKYILMQMR